MSIEMLAVSIAFCTLLLTLARIIARAASRLTAVEIRLGNLEDGMHELRGAVGLAPLPARAVTSERARRKSQ